MVPPYVITLIVIASLVSTLVTYHYFLDSKSLLASIFSGIGIALAVSFILLIVDAMLITEQVFHRETWEEVGKQEQILAPEKGSLLEGSSVFVSGTSDRDMIYTFFVEGPNGSTQAKSIIDCNANAVFLYEVERNDVPHYKEFHTVEKCIAPEWTRWISSCFDTGPYRSNVVLRWEIYVPEGSVSAAAPTDSEQ